MIRRIQRQAEAFAYRLAFLPSYTDSDAPFWLQTTEIPSLNEFDHPAVKEFQEFLDAGLVPPDPKEAVAEYLNHLRPDNRIHYNLLRRYVGEPELDSYPYTMTRPPAPTLPHEPYAEVTYPQGYELDYDDPEPGAHYAGSRHPFDRVAMADTTMWHPRIEQDHYDGHAGWHEGTYRIKEDGQTIGAMQYSMVPEIEHRPVDRRPPKSIIIDKVFVHPQHRGKGIAQSFVERLHNDFPDYKIDPGATTTHGNGFAEHLRKILPDAEHALIPDYTPNVMDDRASDFYDRTQRGYYRAYSGDEDESPWQFPDIVDAEDEAIQHAASVIRAAAALVVDPPTLECNHRTPCPPGTCPQRDIAADPDFYAEFPDPADKEREFQDLYRLQHEDDAADARATNRPSAVEKAEILPPAQPARDILTEFLHQHAPSQKPITSPCAKCQGSGGVATPSGLGQLTCPECDGRGALVNPDVEAKMQPWAERLENALYNEFMEWWPQSEASRIRKPEGSGTKWADRPKEPVTHWLNVEDFLNERYPDAATGATYGGEEAQNLLERAIQEKPDPKWLEERGYVGYGNPVTQAMLTLHNRFNRRPWRNKEDRRRYYELMLRHVGPGAAQRQKVAASSEHYEPMDDDFLDGLRKQFDEWAATSPDVVNPDPDGLPQPRGPVGHWPNIEKFFQEKYPAAYKGLSRGLESAVPALDSDAGDYCPHCTGEGYLLNENPHPADLPRKCLSCSGTGKINDDLVYETGPDAEAKYGYDPKAVAAGLLYLHSESHPYRFHMRQEDHNRLTDIFQKRMKMQRQYEQRTAAPNRTESLSSSPDTDSIIYGLSSEFNDWAKANNKNNPHDDRYLAMPIEEYAKAAPRNWKPRGPVGYWPNIEEFMKERYPAAHRGLSMGFEDADPLLDSGGKHEDGTDLEWLVGKDPYETGPEAVAKHGYDPREIAATLLLLHNDTHPGRENYLKSDQARLLDIAQKRHQMQRAYEEKQKVATGFKWITHDPRSGPPAPEPKPAKPKSVRPFDHPLVDTIGKEFDDWATANGAENPNDHPDSLGYWGKPRGAIGYWPNVEEFLEENYPEAHRGLEMGLEGAGSLRDYGATSSGMYFPEYQSGAWAEAQHGYDPKEVVTALLLLHNQTHPNRWEQVNVDQDVLMDIAQKRHKMQKAYDERMKQEVTATLRYAQQVLAMPWQDWSDKIQDTTDLYSGPGCTSGTCGKTNVYHVMHRPGTSFLNYDHKSVEVTTDDGPVSVPYLAVNTIHVDPNYRKDGIAEALMRRLHQDHPGVFINPGPMTDDGRALLRGLTEKIPESRELIIGRAQHTWNEHLAAINRLGAELSDDDAAMIYDYMQKLFQPIKPSGKWYHVSPHALADGIDLIPGGGDSPSQSFYDDGWGEDTGTLTDMGQGRTGHVWLTPDLDDAHFWSAALNAPHIYEVDPHEDPRPWNGTGTDGWVVPGAKIRRKVIE